MEQDGSAQYKDVTAQYNDARAREDQSRDIVDTNRRKEIQFKASHVLLIGFFSWILYAPTHAQSCGGLITQVCCTA